MTLLLTQLNFRHSLTRHNIIHQLSLKHQFSVLTRRLKTESSNVSSLSANLLSSETEVPIFPDFPRNRRDTRTIQREDINWFPGHIDKGSRTMNRRMAAVDFFIELHDARLPFTARTELLSQFGQVRPYVLVLNKTDLAAPFNQDELRNKLMNPTDHRDPPIDVFFTNLLTPEKQKPLLFRIMERIGGALADASFSGRGGNRESSSALGMVAGLPNVGKSTLINALRGLSRVMSDSSNRVGTRGRVKATRVGRLAGITRGVGEKIRVWEDPPLFVLDTPGVLDHSSVAQRLGASPREVLETTLRLGVCSNLDMNSLNPEIFADYLLHYWNSRGHFEYVSRLGLPGPTHSIIDLLLVVCQKQRMVFPGSAKDRPARPDVYGAARYLLRIFGEGRLGKLTFDDIRTSNAGLPFRIQIRKSVSIYPGLGR